jgi:site-specific DNA-methyltransferase (adenine-specific)
LYCSKYANGKYAVSKFDNPDGNIRFAPINHTWDGSRCKYCGASKEQYQRDGGLETHAYEFIHANNPEEIFNMKFDVIIGNPPYQLMVNKETKQSIPLYHRFIVIAKELDPKYVSMIVPSRWFAGGIGLDDFRNQMKSENKIRTIIDYKNEKECFSGVDVAGGVNYFLWDRDYNGPCTITNVSSENRVTETRSLDEFSFIVRDNLAVDIIHKILSRNERMLSDGGCSVQTPYGFLSTFEGDKEKKLDSDCRLLTSKGWQFVRRESVLKSKTNIDSWKPFISKLSCEHAGTPDKNGMYRVISKNGILAPGEICNQSYLTVCPQDSEKGAENVLRYLRTKIVRFLVQSTLIGMNISQNNFQFVPWQDFSKQWKDEDLIKKYNITDGEFEYVCSVIRDLETD